MQFLTAIVLVCATLTHGSLRKAPSPAMVNKDALKAPAEEKKAPAKEKACVCANGKPCTNPEVPGHPESECVCASPQGECPDHKNGTSTHEDWGAEYENPQTETQWKGKVGDTTYYREKAGAFRLNFSLLALIIGTFTLW